MRITRGKHSRGECPAEKVKSSGRETGRLHQTTLHRHAGSAESRQGDSPRIRSNGLITAATRFGVEDEFPRLADEQPHDGKIVSTERSRRLELVPVPVGALDCHLVVRDSSSVNFRHIGEDTDGDAASAKYLCGLHCTRSGSGLFGIGHTKRGKGIDSPNQSMRPIRHSYGNPATFAPATETFVLTNRPPCGRSVSLRATINKSVHHKTLLVRRNGESVEPKVTGQGRGKRETNRRVDQEGIAHLKRGLAKSGGAVRGSSPVDQ